MPAPNPMTILEQAIKQVPALRYAFGVLGIVSVLVIVKMFQLTPGAAWFGVIAVVVLMVLLFVFAKAVTSPAPVVRGPAIFLIWSFLILSVASGFLIFASVFFNWPKPLDELIKEIGDGGSGDSAQVDNIPKKDFSKIIQTPAQACVLHWCGLPSAQLLLTFHNPYHDTLKIGHLALVFTAPDGSSFTLRPEAIILANGSWNPVADPLEVKNGQDITWAYSFFGGVPTELQLLLQKGTVELSKKPPIATVPDPNAQNFSPELTTAFVSYMNQNFKWTAGKWKMDVTASYGEGSQIEQAFNFTLAQSDIDAMKAISKYYASGIGLIWVYRFVPYLDEAPGKWVDLATQ